MLCQNIVNYLHALPQWLLDPLQVCIYIWLYLLFANLLDIISCRFTYNTTGNLSWKMFCLSAVCFALAESKNLVQSKSILIKTMLCHPTYFVWLKTCKTFSKYTCTISILLSRLSMVLWIWSCGITRWSHYSPIRPFMIRRPGKNYKYSSIKENNRDVLVDVCICT